MIIVKNIIMKTINGFVELLYPPRCPVCDDIVVPRGESVCLKCRKVLSPVGNIFCLKCGKPLKNAGQSHCSECTGKKRNFDECRSAFIYDDAMRKSIYRFKYNNRREYAKYYADEIVHLLGDKIKNYNAQAIIPVPMYIKKERKRGYNQAFLIANEVSHLTNIPVLDKYVQRNKSTKIMRHLGAKERENNLKKAFKISDDVVKLNDVIVIDDIFTTGATIDAVAMCLKEHGTGKVYGICLSTGCMNE